MGSKASCSQSPFCVYGRRRWDRKNSDVPNVVPNSLSAVTHLQSFSEGSDDERDGGRKHGQSRSVWQTLDPGGRDGDSGLDGRFGLRRSLPARGRVSGRWQRALPPIPSPNRVGRKKERQMAYSGGKGVLLAGVLKRVPVRYIRSTGT